MVLVRNSLPPAEALYPGWIDDPNAIEILSSLNIAEWQSNALVDLIKDGFTIIKGITDPVFCDAVLDDYSKYCEQNAAYVAENLDTLGRENRLVNFHLWSDNEMKVVTNPAVMDFIDLMFGERTGVYTSLTFKYGTQQPIHRDTPHFATWPQGRYCGMWTALENVRPDAGPLMYIRGGHRFRVDHLEIIESVKAAHPEMSETEQDFLALDIYNGRIIDEAPLHGELTVAAISKGDVVIWHPEAPHGGSPAVDPMLSRWSVVAHCAPESTQVHQHSQFFRFDRETEPPPRYGFGEAYDRKIAASGATAFM